MQWFKKLRLATQLNLAFALVATISVVVGIFGVRGTLAIHEMMADAYANCTLAIVYTTSANQAVCNYQRALGNIILAPDLATRKAQGEHLLEYQAAALAWIAKERTTTVIGDLEQNQWKQFHIHRSSLN